MMNDVVMMTKTWRKNGKRRD